MFTSSDHGVKLADHDSALRHDSKFTSSQFVGKMTEGIVIFLFASGLLDGKLKLAKNTAHEEIVDEDVV